VACQGDVALVLVTEEGHKSNKSNLDDPYHMIPLRSSLHQLQKLNLPPSSVASLPSSSSAFHYFDATDCLGVLLPFFSVSLDGCIFSALLSVLSNRQMMSVAKSSQTVSDEADHKFELSWQCLSNTGRKCQLIARFFGNAECCVVLMPLSEAKDITEQTLDEMFARAERLLQRVTINK